MKRQTLLRALVVIGLVAVMAGVALGLRPVSAHGTSLYGPMKVTCGSALAPNDAMANGWDHWSPDPIARFHTDVWVVRCGHVRRTSFEVATGLFAGGLVLLVIAGSMVLRTRRQSPSPYVGSASTPTPMA